MTTVTVVTPWLDHPELAEGYAAAIFAGRPERVVVIDNGSDPPVDLHEHWRWHIEGGWKVYDKPTIPTISFDGQNLGFARACNEGLRRATTDAVVFLNNDVRLGDPAWLDALREELRPGVLVGAHLRNDPHAAIDGRNQPYLDGWCLAGMTADLLQLGGFDETFDEPAYYGDNDLCLRARHNGFRLVQARATLHHLGGVTRRGIDGIVDGVTARNYERYAAKARALRAAA